MLYIIILYIVYRMYRTGKGGGNEEGEGRGIMQRVRESKRERERESVENDVYTTEGEGNMCVLSLYDESRACLIREAFLLK